MTIKVFVGYDPREAVAFHVCCNSIIRNSSEPVSITPLYLANLCPLYEELHTDGSNQFIYTRFLVPYLCGFSGHAIFLDGDMLVQGDISELWAMRDPTKGAQVVKHDYRTKAKTKYLGAKNQDYPRKNWSSVILWNCGFYPNRKLIPEAVKSMTGDHLHRFTWLKDEQIGELPKEWNWLETEYESNQNAKLIHHTLGSPCFADYAHTDTSHLWHRELLRTVTALGESPHQIIERAGREA